MDWVSKNSLRNPQLCLMGQNCVYGQPQLQRSKGKPLQPGTQSGVQAGSTKEEQIWSGEPEILL